MDGHALIEHEEEFEESTTPDSADRTPTPPPRAALTPSHHTRRSCHVASCAQHPFVGTRTRYGFTRNGPLGLGEGGVLSLLPQLYTRSNDTGTSTTPPHSRRRFHLRWASSELAEPARMRLAKLAFAVCSRLLRTCTRTCIRSSSSSAPAHSHPTAQYKPAHRSPPNPHSPPPPAGITRLTAVGVSTYIIENKRTTLASSRLHQAPRPAPENGRRTLPNTPALSSHYVLEGYGDAREQVQVNGERGTRFGGFSAAGWYFGGGYGVNKGGSCGRLLRVRGGRRKDRERDQKRKKAQVYVRITRPVALIHNPAPGINSSSRSRLLGATRPAHARSARLQYTRRGSRLSLGRLRRVGFMERGRIEGLDALMRRKQEYAAGYRSSAVMECFRFRLQLRLRRALVDFSAIPVALTLPVRLHGPLRRLQSNAVYGAVVYSLALALGFELVLDPGRGAAAVFAVLAVSLLELGAVRAVERWRRAVGRYLQASDLLLPLSVSCQDISLAALHPDAQIESTVVSFNFSHANTWLLAMESSSLQNDLEQNIFKKLHTAIVVYGGDTDSGGKRREEERRGGGEEQEERRRRGSGYDSGMHDRRAAAMAGPRPNTRRHTLTTFCLSGCLFRAFCLLPTKSLCYRPHSTTDACNHKTRPKDGHKSETDTGRQASRGTPWASSRPRLLPAPERKKRGGSRKLLRPPTRAAVLHKKPLYPTQHRTFRLLPTRLKRRASPTTLPDAEFVALKANFAQSPTATPTPTPTPSRHRPSTPLPLRRMRASAKQHPNPSSRSERGPERASIPGRGERAHWHQNQAPTIARACRRARYLGLLFAKRNPHSSPKRKTQNRTTVTQREIEVAQTLTPSSALRFNSATRGGTRAGGGGTARRWATSPMK
ncbi:hypothetical protein B0H16DRAFT_1479742 [Mycena metata]|uniref:Uncharacterized protein n=1 Tax=Mycena metata TaxID=1033252 RepID=A0AAD7MDR0_9AGAR|nr:hypothetical protein B0H16DRAFT_1479742 [Mycena metata]